MPLRGFVQMDQILIGNVRDGLVHGCLYPWEATSTGGVQRLLCPSCVMSVTNYIRDGLFIIRDGLCFGFYTHSLIHSLTSTIVYVFHTLNDVNDITYNIKCIALLINFIVWVFTYNSQHLSPAPFIVLSCRQTRQDLVSYF